VKSFYVTMGERGPLKATGHCNTELVTGPAPCGGFLHPGEPPERYTKKESEHDVWCEKSMGWVANPDLERVIAEQLASELAARWAQVKRGRNALLAQSDWTQLPDVPLTTQAAWAAYRQALRDVPNQPDPLHIVWPVAPGGAGAS